MAQQEVVYGQISQQLHSSEALKQQEEAGDYIPQPAPEFLGFVPFHQRPAQPSPSLSLSLERPDAYSNVNLQKHFQNSTSATASLAAAEGSDIRPSDGGSRPPFDLEQQPFQHMQQHPDYEVGHGEDMPDHQHQLVEPEHASEAQMMPTDEDGLGSAEEGMQLQIVPASEYPGHEHYGQQHRYPLATATHDAVVQDPELFMTTLDNFLAALGTSLTVPKIAGKEINLHDFYCKVTARGGLEQVIRSSQWKELSKAMDMPRSSLSTSYVLRKHYISLLFHYEQVYFFRREGPPVPLPVALPAPDPAKPLPEAGSPYEVPPELRSLLKKKKRGLDPMQVFGVDPAASIGSNATGAISGKFDEGYFVTVVVGTEKLTGVLYHISPRKKNQQFASVPSLLDGIGTEGNTPGLEIQLYGKKRKERVKRNGPKRTRTGYNIFFKEQRAKLSQLYPEKKGLGKKVIDMWNKLPEEDKAHYISRGNVEREKYLTEYREKMKQQQSQAADVANNAGTVAQTVVEHDHGAYYVSQDYHVSLDVESELQSGNPHASDMDQVYHGYDGNEAKPQMLESETAAGHLFADEAYEGHQDEDSYPQEPVSEEGEDDNEMGEETYEGEEDEKIFQEEEGNEYQVSDQEYNVPEGTYPMHPNDVQSHDPKAYNGSVTPKQPYYGQDHGYAYVPPLPQQEVEGPQGSARIAALDRAPSYPMRDNGQVIYPHMQKGHPDMPLENAASQQHLYVQDRYAYSQARQVQGGEMSVPIPPEQGAYRRQDEAGPYFHQNQGLGSNIQTRQMPPDKAYSDRYGYSVQVPHAQMYSRPPHSYPVRFPHPSYPMQWNEAQAFQHGPAYAPQLHQPQAVAPEVSGVRPTSQAYQLQDGRHSYKG